ncbi:MAG: type II secretion system secretin GspD [Gammaproteobacteria bacterium]|nr:type II secretion system secretin GspD [Gammaproteobacteria bacterium]
MVKTARTIAATALLGLALAPLVLPSGAAAAAAADQTWTINIKNADIREFVTQVAEITGETFVVDPRLKGEVTVISSTPLNAEGIYELFLSVLRVHGFIASPSGDVIRIQQSATGKQTPGLDTQLSQVAPEELVTRVIAAQNVESTELVKILRPLIPQYGHIAAVAEPNIVIISDHADNILRLIRIIEQIDVAEEDEIVVVPLQEAWVETVVELLERLAPSQIGASASGPQSIQIIANKRNNSLIVRGKPRPVAEILKIVELIDKPATATGGVRVVYLKHADAVAVAEVLKGTLDQRSSGDDAEQAATIQADESLNAIIIRAAPSAMTEILDILDQLDIRRTQVLIEAAVVEVQMTDQRAIGAETSAADAEGRTSPIASSALDGVITNLIQNLSVDGEGNQIDADVLAGLASISSPTLAVARIDPEGFSFGSIITALGTASDANLLSTPSLMTLDNQEAKIVVGNEVPFRTGSFTTQADGANNPFTTVQREDVGLQLTVTPHVHDGTSVRLDISQQITNVVDSPIGDAGFADVVTSKREIETTVLAEDRQIIVLGGLIQDNISESSKKVPVLGDIPGLGFFFRSSSRTATKTNLLIFLRPTIIRSQEDANDATERKYRDIWEVEITSPVSEPMDALFEGTSSPPYQEAPPTRSD